MFLFAAV